MVGRGEGPDRCIRTHHDRCVYNTKLLPILCTVVYYTKYIGYTAVYTNYIYIHSSDARAVNPTRLRSSSWANWLTSSKLCRLLNRSKGTSWRVRVCCHPTDAWITKPHYWRWFAAPTAAPTSVAVIMHKSRGLGYSRPGGLLIYRFGQSLHASHPDLSDWVYKTYTTDF